VNQRTNPLPYIISAAGGGLLFIFLFLDWYGASSSLANVSGASGGASAWKAFTIVDIALCLIAIATVAIGVVVIFSLAPNLRLNPRVITTLGTIALTLTIALLWEFTSGSLFGKLLDPDVGGFLSILACLAIVAGGILAERPDLAARVAAATGPGPASRGAAPPPASPPPPPTAPPAADAPTTRVQQPAASTPAIPPPASRSPVPPAQSEGPPAGWYPDPQGEARLRYWDGTGWTGQTSA